MNLMAAIVDFNPAMKLVPAPQVQVIAIRSLEDLAQLAKKNGN